MPSPNFGCNCHTWDDISNKKALHLTQASTTDPHTMVRRKLLRFAVGFCSIILCVSVLDSLIRTAQRLHDKEEEVFGSTEQLANDVIIIHRQPQLQNLVNPRFRRSLLNSTPDESNGLVIRRDREGPLVELKTKESSDVLVTVKTTEKFHQSRVRDIVDTWFRLAPDQIYFFTDGEDAELSRKTRNHLVATKCPSTHKRQALSCKLEAELNFFLKDSRSWMCHFDDDNYVNMPELMRTLDQFDPNKDWYLGRPSTRGPIEIMSKEKDAQSDEMISFWFATGGAGFCISRSLIRKMAPYIENGKFVELADIVRLPDDVTLGYLIEHLLGRRLTVVDKFHSHLESMVMQKLDTMPQQISFGAGSYDSKPNVVNVPSLFPMDSDQLRFRSLHCFLFPKADICPRDVYNNYNAYNTATR